MQNREQDGPERAHWADRRAPRWVRAPRSVSARENTVFVRKRCVAQKSGQEGQPASNVGRQGVIEIVRDALAAKARFRTRRAVFSAKSQTRIQEVKHRWKSADRTGFGALGSAEVRWVPWLLIAVPH